MEDNWADQDVIDVRAVAHQLWARRWWIMLSVVVCTALLTTYAIVATRIYRATTVLVPTSAERNNLSGALGSALSGVGGLASLAGLNLGSGDSATQEALGVLRSRQFTERFISELNLLPVLFPKQWDARAGKWKVTPEQRPTLAKANHYFDKRIRMILPDKKTGLVTLQIDWLDPELAASWANELVRRLNEEMRTRAIESSADSVKFLEKELEGTTQVETRAAINRLMEAQIKQRMLANVTHEYAFRVVDRALPADRDDPIKPKKLLLLAAGPLVGVLLGVLGILGFDWFAGRVSTRSARP
jgi:uncharacterized protein involved in exopolysaccharide biosynthesis